MSVAAEKIERCSAQMLLRYPWWASLYLNLVRIETESVPTMAVDGTHLFYNPTFTVGLTDLECIGVLMHETAHCAFLHCYRKKWREHERWNVASDKAVNAVLAAANIVLPARCVPPGALGSLAEELYEGITPEEIALYTQGCAGGGILRRRRRGRSQAHVRKRLAGCHRRISFADARLCRAGSRRGNGRNQRLERGVGEVHSHHAQVRHAHLDEIIAAYCGLAGMESKDRDQDRDLHRHLGIHHGRNLERLQWPNAAPSWRSRASQPWS